MSLRRRNLLQRGISLGALKPLTGCDTRERGLKNPKLPPTTCLTGKEPRGYRSNRGYHCFSGS